MIRIGSSSALPNFRSQLCALSAPGSVHNRPVQTLLRTSLAHPKYTQSSHFSISRLRRKLRPRIIKSPTTTLLPRLSQQEKDSLPYPPDAIPGARDVDTPYGTIRVNEWGPEAGRKVLLIHGLTTSSIAVGAIAHRLVQKGCRVMTFDLWGHGYTDTPASVPHNTSLYTSQILLALASSHLPWTGEKGFGLIGCSLGGAISAAFAGYFPRMVDDLALLVPVGLVREDRVRLQLNLLKFAKMVVPRAVLERAIRWRLGRPLFEDDAKISRSEGERKENGSETQASLTHPRVTVPASMQWATQNHSGFYTSFMSTALNMPGTGQLERWKLLRSRQKKTLIIAAANDPIIVKEELYVDAKKALGEKLEWRILDGGHDVTVRKPRELANLIWEVWELEKSVEDGEDSEKS